MPAVPFNTLDPNVREDVVAIIKCRENPDTVFSVPPVVRIVTERVAPGHARYLRASARARSMAPVDGGFVRIGLVPGQDPTMSIRYDHEAA